MAAIPRGKLAAGGVRDPCHGNDALAYEHNRSNPANAVASDRNNWLEEVCGRAQVSASMSKLDMLWCKPNQCEIPTSSPTLLDDV